MDLSGEPVWECSLAPAARIGVLDSDVVDCVIVSETTLECPTDGVDSSTADDAYVVFVLDHVSDYA